MVSGAGCYITDKKAPMLPACKDEYGVTACERRYRPRSIRDWRSCSLLAPLYNSDRDEEEFRLGAKSVALSKYNKYIKQSADPVKITVVALGLDQFHLHRDLGGQLAPGRRQDGMAATERGDVAGGGHRGDQRIARGPRGAFLREDLAAAVHHLGVQVEGLALARQAGRARIDLDVVGPGAGGDEQEDAKGGEGSHQSASQVR